MIIGIGVDLIDLPSFRRLLTNYFDEFCSRCFSEPELLRIQRCADPILMAGRFFAIKEAAFKALGTGPEEVFCWEDIHVTQEGIPTIHLSASCEAAARLLGIKAFFAAVSQPNRGAILASVIAHDGA